MNHHSSLSLAYILLVPFDSSVVTVDLHARHRLWPLIRCAVVSLWRSRVASHTTRSAGLSAGPSALAADATTSAANHNRLLLVFADRLMVELDESSIVEMAERHQAAPCEHQVVQLIQKQIQEAQRQLRTGGNAPSSEQHRSPQQEAPEPAFNDWVERVTNESTASSSTLTSSGEVSKSIVVLDIHPEEGLDLGSEFYRSWNRHDDPNLYASHQDDESNQLVSSIISVVVLLSLPDLAEQMTTPGASKSYGTETSVSPEAASDRSPRDGFLRALSQRHGAVLLRASLIRHPCLDRCAASIALLQHFGYQDPCFFHSLKRASELCTRRSEAPTERTAKIEPPRKKLKKAKKSRK
jgi:hypothetical protein